MVSTGMTWAGRFVDFQPWVWRPAGWATFVGRGQQGRKVAVKKITMSDATQEARTPGDQDYPAPGPRQHREGMRGAGAQGTDLQGELFKFSVAYIVQVHGDRPGTPAGARAR